MTVCCLGSYRAITTELIERIMASRLYEASESIDIALLGGAADRAVVEELVRPHDRFRIAYTSDHLDDYEFPALGVLQDACRDWTGFAYYLHSKGVSRHPADQHGRYWRQLMLDRIVDGHAECIASLEEYDAVGTNWRGNHYSGNFWWARSEHIARLPDIRSLRQSPRLITRDRVWNVRLQCEFWIGMAPGRFANLGVSGLDLDGTFRWTHDAADVVGELLAANGGDRYLELAIDGPSPYFQRVPASIKRAVSLGERSERLASADLAEVVEDGPFDVVFVDTWHEESVCHSAIEASLDLLSPSGAILVHDSNPPTEWHGRPASDFRPGDEWNGDAWRAVVRFRRERPDIDVRTVDTDWGCTIIRPGVRARDPLPTVDRLDWATFERRRSELLNLVSLDRLQRDLYATRYVTGQAQITTRTDVINGLISHFGYERYLEIGVGEGENFQYVIAAVRHGVDPECPATFRMSSTEFFARDLGCREYDLIFIDGLHEEVQCLDDIEHALARLSMGGSIVVHDANPPTDWHQRPASEYQPGEPWNGTVWKAIVRLRHDRPTLPVVTLDVDWGCAVIRPDAQVQVPPPPLAPVTWDAFDAHRTELLNLMTPTWSNLVGLDDPASIPIPA